MQAIAIPPADYAAAADLIDSMHRLRAKVFQERLDWDVDVRKGREVDSCGPTYILAVTRTREVVGCGRLLPATGPTMMSVLSPDLGRNGFLRPHAAMIASSRFCVDTSLEADRAGGLLHEVTLTMFAAIIEWSMGQGYSEIVTGTDVRFERILKRAGWPMRRVGDRGASAKRLPWRDCFRSTRTASNACGPRPTSRSCSRASVPPDGDRGNGPAPLASAPRAQATGRAPRRAVHRARRRKPGRDPAQSDGRLFIERLEHGLAAAGEMTAAAAEIVIGSVAHALRSEAGDEQPIGGHRFEGLLPPSGELNDFARKLVYVVLWAASSSAPRRS